MDFFNEFIVRKNKDAKDFLIIAGAILGSLVLLFLLTLFGGYLQSFLLLFIVAVFYGLYYVISSLNIEFEYIVTNGELDIDKIISRRRRKRLVSVNSKDFEYFAPVNANHKKMMDASDINKKIMAASCLNAPNAYFALYHKNNEKFCLIIEPTEKMIKEFSLRMPRSMFYTE